MLAGADQLQGQLSQPASHGLGFEASSRVPAAELTQVVGELGAISRPYLARLPLDHIGLPGCSDACVEESFKVRYCLQLAQTPCASLIASQRVRQYAC